MYGIQVNYPSNWKIEQKDFRGGDFVTNIVEFRPPFDSKSNLKNPIGRQLISFGIYHFAQPLSLDFAANEFVAALRADHDDYKTVSTKTRGPKFDGKPAMEIVYEHEDNNQLFKRIFLGFLNGSDIYYASYRMKEKNFDKFLPVFDSMVESYNFTTGK